MKRNSGALTTFFIVFLVFIVITTVANTLNNSNSNAVTYTYSNLLYDLNEGNISRVEISTNTDVHGAGSVRVFFTDPARPSTTVPITWMDDFHGHLNYAMANHNIDVITLSPPRSGTIIQFLIPIAIVVSIIIFMFVVINQMQGGGSGGGGGNRVMNFGKSRAKMSTETDKKITFKNVAGLEEEKNDLEELVDFLKSPKKYTDIGARIPKGILLVGPPGTGKTLLAKAVAGESGSTFFSISGSDFVEMFVGVGASRVRDLFEQAKKNTPCIVFIDEIDAVGRKRGAGLGGGHDEREQTLNQLLVEMDGFGTNEGIVMIAATNRPDILDPALLRPGRFDRQVVVGRPDVKGREEILKVHASGKQMSKDVDLKVVARTTSGFTGADLENLLNEAALLTARNNKQKIDMEEIRKAFVKIGIGTEKKSRVITLKEKKVTAYHEAGHAILQEMSDLLDGVHMISIIPTGMAGGYMMPLPKEDKLYLSKKAMEQEIVVSLGGRVAEEIILGDITTGASGDIEKVTSIARNMVTKYGMSNELGPILFGEEQTEVFLGRDISGGRNYGEKIATSIDAEINRIITTAYTEARRILTENIQILHDCANLLLEKEKITGEEFRKLFKDGVLPDKNRSIEGTLLDRGLTI
ncbi:MAG: ATP-dependent zinc metalloprotease FtsH [Defluviitaleaceae bacterium]|nr:ATP-dependent zinc metalloprotease FtsH [Defluviitaleaceae bacterium]